ncbi:hypothetical protein P9112_012263 [Eukaryota sp. TZLM1-RC]
MTFFATDYASDFFQNDLLDVPVIAYKIKDGLFIGGAEAAYRSEFITSNKITHIINCASGQVDERWSSHGIKYLSFPWRDDSSCIIIDPEGRNLRKVHHFIKAARSVEQCVLIHSLHGRSRCVALTAAYLMDLFKWSYKTVKEFLSYKISLQHVKPSLLRQLEYFSRTIEASDRPLSPSREAERELLFNTHLNTCLGGLIQPREGPYFPQFKPIRRQRRRSSIKFGESSPNRRASSPGTPILRVKSPSVAPYGVDEEEWQRQQEEANKNLADVSLSPSSPSHHDQSTPQFSTPKQEKKSTPIVMPVLDVKVPSFESSSEDEASSSSSKFFAIQPSPRARVRTLKPVEEVPSRSVRAMERSRDGSLSSSKEHRSKSASSGEVKKTTKKVRRRTGVSSSLLAPTASSASKTSSMERRRKNGDMDRVYSSFSSNSLRYR